MGAPARPRLFHIVHVDRLESISGDGYLWPDSVMASRSIGTTIGMRTIKRSRLTREVSCHPGTFVGEYVPFYLWPRSVMLFLIHCANHPELEYKGGQEPIVHLMADLRQAVEWADSQQQKWALTDMNAASRAAEFYGDLAGLDQLDWNAIRAKNWAVKRDGKMAEFLVQSSFPWTLIQGIGVFSEEAGARALQAMRNSHHRPPVKVKRDWYY